VGEGDIVDKVLRPDGLPRGHQRWGEGGTSTSIRTRGGDDDDEATAEADADDLAW
jgi:hypothetical protein